MQNGDLPSDWMPDEKDCASFDIIVQSKASPGVVSASDFATSSITVCSSHMMVASSLLNEDSVWNKNIVLSIFRNITGTSDDEQTVDIDPIKVNVQNMVVTTSIVNWVGLGLFTIALPLLVIVLGIVVWIRRRHL